MDTTDYTKLGVIQRVQGPKGHVMALLEHDTGSLGSIETFFIQIDHTLVPYGVEHCTLRNHQAAIIKFQDVDDPTTAHQLKGRALFALQDILPQHVVAEDQRRGLIGYQVVDVEKGSLGPVQRIDTFPLQKLLAVRYLARELLIPYNEAIIKHIDQDQRQIIVHLPPGFLHALL